MLLKTLRYQQLLYNQLKDVEKKILIDFDKNV